MAENVWTTTTLNGVVKQLMAYRELYAEAADLPIMLAVFIPAQQDAGLCTVPLNYMQRFEDEGVEYLLVGSKENIEDYKRQCALAGKALHE
jgi:hypothetical protein